MNTKVLTLLVVITLAACSTAPPLGTGDDEGAAQKKMKMSRGHNSGHTHGAGAPLEVCVPPPIDPRPNSSLDIDYRRHGLRAVQDAAATAGCDVMIQVTVGEGGYYNSSYQATSAYSGASLASGKLDVSQWDFSVANAAGEALGRVAAMFAPGTPDYQRIVMERRQATGVGQRTPLYAPPERQQEIDAAAQEGDDALAAGKGRDAFAAYTRALAGPWSDDETSRRARMALMTLVGGHPDYAPPVPEEARRRMVRAQAILKDSNDFSAYDPALGEMAAAAGAAPWWSDVYYNAALVAEKAGYVDDAMRGFKAYLAANPHASDARAVQDKIYALEVKAERGEQHGHYRAKSR